MSATNSTPNLSLPVFVGSDKPAWLVDFNGAMNTIDTAVGTNTTNISGNATAIANLNNSVTALDNTVSTQGTTITGLVSSVATNTGSINTINSLIGNGTPTTTDQTIIGAINELHADITGTGVEGIQAAHVSYDNTTSGLTASTVQAAIDEIVQGGSGGSVNYSTTEQEIGTWIDGSKLYEKTIDCSAMPNNTTKNVATGITGLGSVVSITGWIHNTGNTQFYPLPYVASGGQSLEIGVNGTDIKLSSSIDFSSYSGYATIRYTKTS